MTEIDESQIIFTPPIAIYNRREDAEYSQLVKDVPLEEIIQLVQKRVEHDGEWCIANGRVGKDNKNEAKMRAMMEFASNVKHIKQAVNYVYKEGSAGAAYGRLHLPRSGQLRSVGFRSQEDVTMYLKIWYRCGWCRRWRQGAKFGLCDSCGRFDCNPH